MRRPLEVKGRHLGQSSDLTLFAPLKQGLVGSLEAVTYKSRTKRLLEGLHAMRSRSHEYAYMRLISDAVERVGAIQSVRVAVIEPQDMVLLSVTFDGNWASYLRVLWHKVGALLDLIFCNTEGYVDAKLNRFEDWAAWVHRVQTETSFFYGAPAATARDVLFQRRQERRRLAGPADAARDVREATDVLPGAEADASLDTLDPDLNAPLAPEITPATLLRQGLATAAALYRFADQFLPGSPDGDRLHRAATELLQEFVVRYGEGVLDPGLDMPEGKLRERYARELAWLFGAGAPGKDGGADAAPWPKDLANVQGGILDGWRDITHGALVMLSFDAPDAAARFLDTVRKDMATAATNHDVAKGTTIRTVALTIDGLYALGADSTLLDAMPEEFRQGMAARAGLLGDVRRNHPDRWTPPPSWRAGGGRVALAAVHAVVQLRTNTADDKLIPILDTTDPQHPLYASIKALDKLAAGARVVAVESMRRLYKDVPGRAGVHEHFGYEDGLGQPQIAESVAQPDYAGNVLPVGELLLGYPNSADANGGPSCATGEPTNAWLHDGSFLVVRKYRQHIDRFEQAISSVKTAAGKALDPEVVAGKLMGRDRKGHPLVDPAVTGNAFDYRRDAAGVKCPLPAHIRRGNPRDEASANGARPAGSRPARIMRRSMSFGPTVEENKSGTERGLIFMAYNSSLAEQFEVVQRWMVGGNSSGTSSGASCPLLGVAESGRERHFRFVHDNETVHAELDGQGPLFDDPLPLVQLDWGAYLWVPSLAAIDRLIALAGTGGADAERAWSLPRGRALLEGLLGRAANPCPHSARLAWKAALEDVEAMSSFDSASLWAAIRADHGGVLRTPYGVLVGEHALLHTTLTDPGRTLSAAGYQSRLRDSLGEIYLGLDDTGAGCRYRAESDSINAAIGKLAADKSFALARDAVTKRIDALVKEAVALADLSVNPRFETTFEPRELFDEVLATLCEEWCGLTEAGGRFTRGPARWDWKPGEPPQYPGHFVAPSRHTFQPHPGKEVEAFGVAHGRAVTSALRLLIDDWYSSGKLPTQPLAKAILGHPLAKADHAFAARSLAGVVMGFVPTLDGALRSLAQEWLGDGTFWSLRAQFGGKSFTPAEAKARLQAPLQRALQLRPVPDVIWRTSAKAQEIGGLHVEPAETVVFGLASAAQQMLASGREDSARSMFGGVRRQGGATHACPGHDAAMAVLLGAMAGLVSTKHPLAPVLGTTALRIEGDSNVSHSTVCEAQVANKEWKLHRFDAKKQDLGTVMIWGDSWVNRWYRPLGKNLAHQIEGLSCTVPGGVADLAYPFDTAKWLNLSAMAGAVNDPLIKANLQDAIKDLAPKAILLSGGGNDAAGATLLRLVHPSPRGLDTTEVAAFVWTELKGYFISVIELIQATPRSDGSIVPVVLHGYDHPIPEIGGGYLGQYLCGSKLRYSESEAAGIMRDLIDELNKMMATLPSLLTKGTVTHVKLTGVLERAMPGKAKTLWSNELHPTPKGFALLAEEIVKVL